MILQIAGHRSLRVMRAIPDVVDDGALRGELGAHPVMQHGELVLGKETARDTGLIGEEEHKISGLVQPADRLRRVRHPANPLTCAHIAVVVIDDAVAVEKGGGSCRVLFRRAVTGIDAHGCSASAMTRVTVATTSEEGVARMQRWSFMVQTVRWQGWQDSCVLVSTVAARPLSGAQR